MKIAAVSEDGVTISQHFGRAPFYIVVTVEDGNVITRVRRDKLGHAQFAGEPHGEHGPHASPHGHGNEPEAQGRHARMVEAIADCDVLLARGMGAGAYESIKRAGIRPVVSEVAGIDEAVQAFLAGKLTDHVEKLH
jgi:predicted Fe-Mo cluster-binding NifX family protein